MKTVEKYKTALIKENPTSDKSQKKTVFRRRQIFSKKTVHSNSNILIKMREEYY